MRISLENLYVDIGLKGLKCAFMQGFGQKGVQMSCRGGPTCREKSTKINASWTTGFPCLAKTVFIIENRQFNNRKVNIQRGCCTVEYLSVK